MESIVVLLTGTIKPVNVPKLMMTDPKFREAEYCKSIKRWISLGYPIIFCENSNYDSPIINDTVKHLPIEKFEYLKFTTSVSQLGKGAGEAEIVEFVFKNSKIIGNHSIICKATGKNFVPNAGRIFNKILQSPLSNKFVLAILMRNLTIADSRFFLFKNEFYLKYWKDQLKQVDESNYISLEHTLAKAILAAVITGESWGLLPEIPRINGYLGTTATKYTNNFLSTLLTNACYHITKKMMGTKNG